jgi:hypothetical protein
MEGVMRMAASGPSWNFGFIDILKGLPVVPKIIMFVGLLVLIIGFFSGPFALFHNPRISAGIALMAASLSWRAWERSRWHTPAIPHEGHWDFKHVFWGLVFAAFAAWMSRICYLAGTGSPHCWI